MDTIKLRSPVYHRVTRLNRRFYSSDLSVYLNYKQVEGLVLNGETVRVFDKKSTKLNQEVTNEIFFKILLKKDVFTTSNLIDIIRAKG